MGKIIFITGGSRSGKSDYALNLGESVPPPRTFVATCPKTDEEMERRIIAHQKKRAASSWETLEETTDLPAAMRRARNSNVIIVDCLTLWINNLMYEAQAENKEITEEDVSQDVSKAIDVCREIGATVIFVSNEVGMGIVPGDANTRLYRDLVGRCNQMFAEAADAAVLMVCGIPQIIKGGIDL